MNAALLLTVLVVAAALPGCGGESRGEREKPEPAAAACPGDAFVALPAPETRGAVPLEETLAARESIREFTDVPLTRQQVGQLLWAAQGVTRPSGHRTAPSAGALYPLELYVALPDGFFRYLPREHGLCELSERDLRRPLARVTIGQKAVEEAPAVLVITAVYSRTASTYGDRAELYVKLEAGHAAQNLLLQVVALGLGAVPIGAFEDAGVEAALRLPSDHEPLYLIPAGHPPE